MPLEKALLMTKQGIRPPSPIGPGRLSLLKGNCQISSPAGRRERSRLPPFHSFCSHSWPGGRAPPLSRRELERSIPGTDGAASPAPPRPPVPFIRRFASCSTRGRSVIPSHVSARDTMANQ